MKPNSIILWITAIFLSLNTNAQEYNASDLSGSYKVVRFEKKVTESYKDEEEGNYVSTTSTLKHSNNAMIVISKDKIFAKNGPLECETVFDDNGYVERDIDTIKVPFEGDYSIENNQLTIWSLIPLELKIVKFDGQKLILEFKETREDEYEIVKEYSLIEFQKIS